MEYTILTNKVAKDRKRAKVAMVTTYTETVIAIIEKASFKKKLVTQITLNMAENM
ncbi:hypothetical protein [Flavobacterium restrictum]|uniref:hypothetical protein n=1 Tax=Flavobacterium restrictum TaxID=2594428 RepID=UPI00163D448E|nr:hypothetical protein [Flavobacterium restrictum]